MEIISRQEAISQGLTKYFTGELCKNGHLAERYVHSCTCQECIRGVPATTEKPQVKRIDIEARKLRLREERLALDQKKAELAAQRLAARPRAKRDDLTDYNAMLHYEDAAYFKAVMLAMAMAIDPTITVKDLTTRKSPTVAGESAIHYMRTFQENHVELRKIEHKLIADRKASGTDRDTLMYQQYERERELADRRRMEEAGKNNGRPIIPEGLTSY